MGEPAASDQSVRDQSVSDLSQLAGRRRALETRQHTWDPCTLGVLLVERTRYRGFLR